MLTVGFTTSILFVEYKKYKFRVLLFFNINIFCVCDENIQRK